MKHAAIDIGTHSVLLLILEKQNGGMRKLADEAALTRIGEGMGHSRRFGAGGMERTLAVLQRYKDLCNRHGVEKITAVGTAAFRKAENAAEFLFQVRNECGLEIEVISGEREAQITWKAASADFGPKIMVVDVGGGSTEIITPERMLSLPIGSVMLTENFVCSDPVAEGEYRNICAEIENHLRRSGFDRSATQGLERLVATAGTATTLGAIHEKIKVYKHDTVHGLVLSIEEIRNIIAGLRIKTVEERKKIPGLEPGRADVILAGSLLVEKTAGHFGFNAVTVSDRGVRWGLLYEAFQTGEPAT